MTSSIIRKLLFVLCVSVLTLSCAKDDNVAVDENEDLKELPEGKDTYGYIKDTSGAAITEVVVTDGYSTVTTDTEGKYALLRNAEAKFVYYSLPSGYKVNVGATYQLPSFYSKLKADKVRYDFTLVKLATTEERFDLICIGDPQVGDGANVVRFKEEIAADMREYVASSGVPCYAISLGDLVNNVWTLFPNMVVAMRQNMTGLPVFQTIGNHDHEYPTENDAAARSKYESYFGPVNYSFNRGKAHIVSMDNVMHGCQTSAEYIAGFSKEQYDWLVEDLSHVPKDHMVILCVHIPFRGGEALGGSNMNTDKYYNEVKTLLAEYSYASIMSAHTHNNQKYVHTAGDKKIVEHITGTTCGAWWKSTVCTDGTPIGYGIFHIDGNNVTEWKYKAARHSEDFQIRLYRTSDKFTGGATESYYFANKSASRIVANIWNWDEDWTVKVYEDNVDKGTMTKYSDKDAWVEAYHVGVLNASDSYASKTSHMFYYDLANTSASVRVEATDRFGNVFTQSLFTDPKSTPGIYRAEY